MANSTIPDSQRPWIEGSTPIFTTTMEDSAGVAIPLANILTLTLTQWVDQGDGKPGKSINGRLGQNVLNANGVTVAASSGIATWQLTASDTALQSKDIRVLKEKHWFRLDLSYNASGATEYQSYVDYYVVLRKQNVV